MQPYLCDFLYEYAFSVGDKGGEVICKRMFAMSSSASVLCRRMFSNIEVCGGKMRRGGGGGGGVAGLCCTYSSSSLTEEREISDLTMTVTACDNGALVVVLGIGELFSLFSTDSSLFTSTTARLLLVQYEDALHILIFRLRYSLSSSIDSSVSIATS